MPPPPFLPVPPPAGVLPAGVLLAAGFDWLEALLPFAFVIFWILSQVFAVFRRLQGNGRDVRRPPLPRFEPGRPPRPAPPAGGDADPRTMLERQIAEFLREATGEAAPRPARPAPRAETTARAPAPAPAPAPRPKPPRAERPEKVATRPSPRPPAGGSGPSARPPSPAIEDSSVARHVQDVFAHELTHLRGEIQPGEPQRGPAAAAAATRVQVDDLVRLLRNPATIRQAILLREVIDRPVERW